MDRPEHSRPGKVDLDGSPSLLERPAPLAMVYGGGGVFGIAYCMGVAQGLADAGIPVATAPALGTSAGSWAASAMALGLGYDTVREMHPPRIPNTRRGVLAEIARDLFGDATTHHLVSVSAVCLRSRRRHILDGGRFALADLVAASSAVPGLLPPHIVDGRLYIDGGMWSATSIDAAASAEDVIVVAPLAGAVLGPGGRLAGMLLQRELATWRRRHPEHRITLVHPTPEIAKLAGRNPLGLFDKERAEPVHPLAYEQGLAVGRALDGEPAAA